VSLVLWISLGVVLVSLTGGAVFVFLRVLSLWRAFKSFTAAVDGLMRELSGSFDRLSTNAEALGSETPKLEAALARLRHSFARVAVLRAAMQDVQDAFGRLTAVYPRK
jgi:sigma54-dependent transcription regulator